MITLLDSFPRPVILFTVLLILMVYFISRRARREKHPYPPGPWGLPVLGHLPFLGRDPSETLCRYRRRYGDVFSIRMGSYPTVVLNGVETIRTALTSRLDDFAGRPNLYTIQLLRNQYKDGSGLTFSEYGDAWKAHRRISNNALRMFANYKNNPIEEIVLEESSKVVEFFLGQNGAPFDPSQELFLAIGSVIYQIVFGRKDNVRQDKNYRKMIESNRDFTEFTKAGNPVDVMPWTRFILRDAVRRFLEITGKAFDLYHSQLEVHLESFQTDALRDVLDALIKSSREITEEEKSLGLTPGQIYSIVPELLGAGFETSGTVMAWILLYMATWEEVQRRVHVEIDQVIGHSKPPRYDDRKNMPYVEATLLETLRFRCTLPLAIPHATTRDVDFMGYSIPKDTFIFLNLASTCNDPDVWEDPDVFRPERFLKEGSIDSSKAEMFLSFGAGRRRCLGEFLAKVELFLLFTSILQRCSVHKAPGETYGMKGVFGLAMSPSPYKIIVKPRH